jgi:hypothetical protein
MATQKHLFILAEGVTAWNRWREEQPVRPDLSLAMLNSSRWTSWRNAFSPLAGINFSDTDLSRANLIGANLVGANLRNANLTCAHLRGADLTGADLSGATLHDATFSTDTKWPEGYDPVVNGAIRVDGDDSVSSNSDDFTITFGPELTPQQITATLAALADYYRSCGGVGLQIDFEALQLMVGDPVGA